MKLNAYLSFDGRCEEALKFYETALGGKIVMTMTYGQSPMAAQLPPDWGQKILHATFALGDQTLGAADNPPGQYLKPQGLWLTLNVDDPAEADRRFKALAEKGAVSMPIQETFWARRFGMLVDRFGTPWMINCVKPEEQRA
ncbi:MAG: VOC family protein [Elusimicrobiota bacterium]